MASVGVAMIVKDSERCLERCLRSIQSSVDEIQVVDTGSTDRSREIARSFGANVSELEWPGRFDVALNVALSLVQSDWVLRLDDDEWLADDTGFTLRQCVDSVETDYAMVNRRDLDDDGGYSESTIVRLYRAASKPQVVGRIHEAVPVDRLHEGGVTKLPIAIWHDGYAGARLREKSLRNIGILQEWVEAGDAPLSIRVELLRTLDQLSMPGVEELASKICEEILAHKQSDELPDSAIPDALAVILDRLPPEHHRSALAEDVLRMARGWCSDNPAVLNSVAQLEARRSNHRAAFDAWKDAADLLNSNEYRVFSTFKRTVLERGIRQNLAIAALRVGRQNVARREWLWLSDRYPDDPAVRSLGQAITSL